MAKTPKPKRRESSLHSRAARRNASPPLKDSTSKTKSDTTTSSDAWIYAAQNAGIQKRKPKAKKLTHNQKIRQQRGLQNAERNIDKHEKKVADSKRRGKKVNNRRQEWEELNGVRVVEKVEDHEDRDGAEREQEKELAVNGGARDEREDGEGMRKGRSFAEGMAEVELQEAVEGFEDFALPETRVEDDEVEAVNGVNVAHHRRDEDAENTALDRKDDVEDVNEIT